MSPFVRICFVQMSVSFQLKKPFGDPSKESLFVGPSSKIQNELGSFGAIGIGGNFSYIGKGTSQDCMESLFRNESDALQSSVFYGRQDFDRIFPVILWRED